MTPDGIDALQAALADRYRLERELGAGGMATVYLARDLRHERDVAIKVLRPELAAVIGAERFLSEIRTTANLQHPHILPLFDSGEAGGFLFYVMPYVEGESLRDRLQREKQLPVSDAVRVATEVASALDYAHRHGVIHRDIKPENVMLHDGQALVADFGIALAVSRTAGTRMTETGMSLGTPHYMSPEQAMGEREITARSDVYALGAVTYEMLVGEPPFTGPTAQAIIAKVMTDKPASVRRLRERVPPEVEEAVLTALEKLPADRFGTAAEFSAALAGRDTGAAGQRARRSDRPPERRLLIAAAAVAVVALAASVWLYTTRTSHTTPALARYEVATPNLRTGGQFYLGSPFAISPDGSRIAFVARTRSGGTILMLREQDDITPHVLAGTDGADAPFFSPDSRWVGYFANQMLYKVSVSGSVPVRLAGSAGQITPGGTWHDDGRIYYSSGRFRLVSVSAQGGQVDTVAAVDSTKYAVFPAAMPGTKIILVTECTNNCAHMDLVAVNVSTHARSVLLPNTARAWPLAGNLIIALRLDGTVVGASLDPARLRLTREPIPLHSGVALDLGITPEMSVSEQGTLLYRPQDLGVNDVTMVRVDRTGRPTVLDPAWHANISFPRLSPDGSRLAVTIGTPGRSDVWVKQLNAGPLTRVTADGVLNYRPAWTPDGQSFSYTSDRDGQSHLYLMRADGSGAPQRLLPRDTTQIDEALWSRDGRWLVYRAGIVDGVRRLYMRALQGDSATELISTGSADEYMPDLSPNGRWLAYVSVESGQEEVFVRPFPGVHRARWQVSTFGGTQPAWSPDGTELFYVSSTDSLVAVSTTGSSATAFHAGQPRALFSTRALRLAPYHRSYDVAPDGRSFLMTQAGAPSEAGTTNLTIVLNWLPEVRALLAGKSN